MRRLLAIIAVAMMSVSINVPSAVADKIHDFRVLTYNTMLLRPIAGKGLRQEKRAELIPGGIKRALGVTTLPYDVIVYNEAFKDDARNILIGKTLIQGYPSALGPGKDSALTDDSGLVIMSKHPMMATDRYTFKACSKTDCRAAKGVLYAKILKGGKYYHVFATHLQANNKSHHVKARTKQLRELNDFIKAKAGATAAKGEPIIIAGDLNIDPSINAGEYKKMFGLMKAVKVPAKGPTFDPKNNDLARWRYEDEKKATLDYILFSSRSTKPFDYHYKIVKPKVAKKKVKVGRAINPKYTADLSDHYGLDAWFRFKF